jgi:hypothetical protein
LVGEKHLALKLKHQGQAVDGIWFGRIEPLPAQRQVGLIVWMSMNGRGKSAFAFWWKRPKFKCACKAQLSFV